MTDVSPIPEGFEGVIPHLVVDGAAKAIDFYRQAFGAEEIMRAPTPDGSRLMHASVRIGGSVVYLCDDFPEMGESRHPGALGNTPVTIHQYVTDTDAAVARAVEAGATMKMPPMDAFWGARYGIVADPFGHVWSFSTHQRDVPPEEMTEAAKEFFDPRR